MSRRAFASLVAVVVLVATLAGCGTSSKPVAAHRLGAGLEGLAQPTEIAATASSGTLVEARARVLFGFSIANVSGASAAEFRIRETGATGKVLAIGRLAASASSTQFFAAQGVQVNSGVIYLQIVSGEVEGTLYWS